MELFTPYTPADKTQWFTTLHSSLLSACTPPCSQAEHLPPLPLPTSTKTLPPWRPPCRKTASPIVFLPSPPSFSSHVQTFGRALSAAHHKSSTTRICVQCACHLVLQQSIDFVLHQQCHHSWSHQIPRWPRARPRPRPRPRQRAKAKAKVKVKVKVNVKAQRTRWKWGSISKKNSTQVLI